MNAKNSGREAVVQHFSAGLEYRRPYLNVVPKNHQAKRYYAILKGAVTPLFRQCDAVRPVDGTQNRNSPGTEVLSRQKPSEKERGVSTETAVGKRKKCEVLDPTVLRLAQRLLAEERASPPSITGRTAVDSEIRKSDSVNQLRVPVGGFVGLHTGGSPNTRMDSH